MAGLPSMEYGIESEAIADYSKLIRGDEIAVSGRFMLEPYYHHGIYLGGGRVADFGGDGKTDAKPRTVSIQDFTDNWKRRLVRVDYMKGHCLSPEESARNAEEFVRNPDRWESYHILLNNCEHFATRCKTGTATSGQVCERVIAIPMNMVVNALTLTGAGSKSALGCPYSKNYLSLN